MDGYSKEENKMVEVKKGGDQMKSLSVKLGVVLVVFCLAGCASKAQWTKPGFNPNEFKQDCYVCEREANILASQQAGAMSSAVNPLLIYAITKKKCFNNCMEAKGYQQFKSDKERELIESLNKTNSDDKERITKSFETQTAKDTGVSGADWKWLGPTPSGDDFIDMENITWVSKDSVRVLQKAVFSEKGVIEMVKKNGKLYKDLDYSMFLLEINCKHKELKLLSATHYSKEEKVLEKFDLRPQEEGVPIPPGTLVWRIYKAVCK